MLQAIDISHISVGPLWLPLPSAEQALESLHTFGDCYTLGLSLEVEDRVHTMFVAVFPINCPHHKLFGLVRG